MKRKTHWLCLTSLSLALILAADPASGEQTPSDHVLLITVDDLNDWIGCLSDPLEEGAEGEHLTGQGHPQARTPHMDRLAKRGVLFTNAHCQAPICRPSRTSLFSGLRPTTSGVYGNRGKYDGKAVLKPGVDVPWLTKRFEAAGYDVYTAGKLLHGSQNKPLGGTPCFKTNQGPYPEKKIGVPAEITPAGVWDIGAYPESEENYTDLRIAKWTASNIRKPLSGDKQPRFMGLGFYNPHVPLFAPQKWFDAAPSQAEVLLGATMPGDLDDLPAIARRTSTRVMFAHVVDWIFEEAQRLRMLTQAYLACTSAMDDALGHVVNELDQSEMADNTWIVVASDHGWHLGEKQHIAKQTLWTRSTRVPLIIVPPKYRTDLARGLRCDRPVELLDIYPTLVDATGLREVESDRKIDGISLLPLLENPKLKKERPALTTLYAHNHSLCNTRYRYTRYADGSEEFYDRQVDPHEFDNLIGTARSDEKLNAVIDELSTWIPKNESRAPDLIDDRIKP